MTLRRIAVTGGPGAGKTSVWRELARYDAVLFLETAAAGGLSIAGGNAVRREDHAAAIAIDRRLEALWSRHPRFHRVGVERDFATKIARGRAALQQWLDGG